VKDVRIKGAIGVVELDRIADVAALRMRFVEEGVFIRPFGNIVYLTPAFTIAPQELKKLKDIILQVHSALQKMSEDTRADRFRKRLKTKAAPDRHT